MASPLPHLLRVLGEAKKNRSEQTAPVLLALTADPLSLLFSSLYSPVPPLSLLWSERET